MVEYRWDAGTFGVRDEETQVLYENETAPWRVNIRFHDAVLDILGKEF